MTTSLGKIYLCGAYILVLGVGQQKLIPRKALGITHDGYVERSTPRLDFPHDKSNAGYRHT